MRRGGDPQVFIRDVVAHLRAVMLAGAVKDGAAIGTWTLPATGGYGAMSVKETFGGKRGPVTAALAFDGTTYLTADLLAKALGFSIIFR